MDKSKWKMLGYMLATQLAVAFVGRSIGPLAPFFESSFHLSKAQVGLLPASLFIGQSIVSVPAGWFVDRWGTRKMVLILSTILSLSFFLVTIVPWFNLALIFIAIGGLGYGSMHPASNRGIIVWFPTQIAGTAMGIKQTGVTSGSALAGLLLIPLAVATSWRWAMISTTLLLLTMGIIFFLLYQDPPEERKKDVFDRPKFSSTLRHLASHKPLVAVSLAAMGLTSAQLSLSTYLVLYVSGFLLYPLIIAGTLFSLSDIGGSLGRIVWGLISDRIFRGERAPVLILIAIITALCSFLTAILPIKVSLWILVPLILLFGFCTAGFNGLWMNFAAEAVPRENAGIASGFSLGIGSLGVVVGPPIFGGIIDKTGSFTSAWIFLSLEMLVVVSLLFWAQREVRNFKAGTMEIEKKQSC